MGTYPQHEGVQCPDLLEFQRLRVTGSLARAFR